MRTTRLYLFAGVPALISVLGCSTGNDTPGQPAVVAPTITVHPSAQSIIAGQNASFSVTATGTTINYQWRRSTDGGASFTDVAGATNATLALTAVPLADNAHQFRVAVSNSAGSVTSNAAPLTVNPAPMIPAFTTQPASITVTAPNPATFSVVATGIPSPTLQWQASANGGGSFADIAGATANSYTTPATSTGDSGNQYRVIATNGSGSATSTIATLAVNPAAPPKTWGTAGLIETNNAGSATSPQIAMDASGNALTVWSQYDGARNNIWANRYTPGTGWGTPALLESDNAGYADEPQISMNAGGNALAVWSQHDGTRTNIWANRYSAGTGWGTAALIETDNTGDASEAKIAMDPNGNALAVWSQDDGTRTNIWANRYTVGIGWGTAVLIETDNTDDAYNVQIAMDPSGNALAVWRQYDGPRRSIWANRYTVGTGWGTAVLIETDNAGDASRPQIAMDTNGNALAVWQQNDGLRENIWANRYVAGTGWGTAALIETDNAGDAGNPKIAFDASGNALAVWSQEGGTHASNIWANRYLAGTGWGVAVLIESDPWEASQPQIALDPNGNALAVWAQHDGTHINMWANRYTIGSGWGTAALIETDNAGHAYYPQIALDPGGNALAVWYQHDGARYNIWSNRFQ
ncbi:MAG: hypothetical protein IPQ13_14720 [Holophagaceae bacterium]|nr:hypothetical protein [Holophagaceae bacterium]